MIRFNQKTKHRSWERFKKFGEGNWEELLLVEVGSKGILNFGYALNFWSRERGGEIGINNEINNEIAKQFAFNLSLMN
jgi:hypothetical protein